MNPDVLCIRFSGEAVSNMARVLREFLRYTLRLTLTDGTTRILTLTGVDPEGPGGPYWHVCGRVWVDEHTEPVQGTEETWFNTEDITEVYVY